MVDQQNSRIGEKQTDCLQGRESLQAVCFVEYLVEMAGIEPASREFDLGYATSLVGLLLFAQVSPNRQGLARTRRSKLVGLALMLPIAIQSIAPRFLWHLIQVYRE